jgi:uncharacterized protein (TIGR03083 family)
MGSVNALTRRPAALDTVEAYASAAERFAVTVAWSDLRAPVVGCPGWSAYDLTVHLGNVHAWAATIVETGRPAAEQNDEPTSSRAKAVSAWYAAKAEDLYEVLRHSSPDEPCWNFVFGSGVAAFWPRRQLHETIIHQVDLDQTRQQETDLDRDTCVDGVSEVLTVLVHRMHHRGHPTSLAEPLALTAVDTGDTWLLRPQPASSSSPRVPTQSSGGTSASPPPSVEHRTSPAPEVLDRVEARADVLYRLLWHRPVDEADLRVSGDEARVRAFLGSRLTP